MTDICLILEGTYPYVSGGVSSWVNDLIRRLSNFTFSVVYLGAGSTHPKKIYYELPENVYDFQAIHIFDHPQESRPVLWKRCMDFELIEKFLDAVSRVDITLFEEILRSADTGKISLYDLAYSWESWKILEKSYNQKAKGESFLDYFWTWRALYLPLFALLKTNLPEARVYHSISTGYAGLLGATAKLRYGRPFLLTEHGIYTRERKIDITQADWIYSQLSRELKVVDQEDVFKDWWLSVFLFMSSLTYHYADEIISLYEGNRQVQIEEGAHPEKTRIIPNGVNIEDFPQLSRKGEAHRPLRVGFVGRVVPIKDVKTFITACQGIHNELPDLEFYIIGPTDEDENYYKECVQLIQMKSLERVIHFTGNVKMQDYYPLLDVLVLTSISEAQPLVILEAAAWGIPVVASAVGACPEMLLGRSGQDRLLGANGIVTPICNPHETAEAVLKILKDPALRGRMREAGRKRISTYYRQEDYIASYQMLYDRYVEEICEPSGSFS